MKLQVYIFSVLTQKIDTIFEQFILNLLNSINMFYWCQVKPFENLWIMNLYKFDLYSRNFSRKIEPVVLYLLRMVPLNVASSVKLLRTRIWRHITTRPVDSLHLLIWNLQEGKENLSGDWKETQNYCVYAKYFNVKCHQFFSIWSTICKFLKQITQVIDHHCYKTYALVEVSQIVNDCIFVYNAEFHNELSIVYFNRM